MYHSVGIERLSDNQIKNLLKGKGVRIKTGNDQKINLSKQQLKKLATAHKKLKAMVLTMDPYQMEQHGSGVFGDLLSSVKKGVDKGVNFVKKYKLQKVVNPLIKLGKKGLHAGLKYGQLQTGVASPFLEPLAQYTHSQINNIPEIGQGFFGDAFKAVAPHLLDLGVDLAKKKISGRGRPIKKARNLNNGGALYPAGRSGSGIITRRKKTLKKTKGKGAFGNVLAGILGQLLPF